LLHIAGLFLLVITLLLAHFFT